jgi:hypothetical protein
MRLRVQPTLRFFLRRLLVAAPFLPAAYGAGTDITIPLDDGNLLIQNVQLTTDGYYPVPALSFVLRNRTSSPWTKLTLQFEVDARCNGAERHWSRTEETFLGWMGDAAFQNADLSEEGKGKATMSVREYTRRMLIPQGKVDSCTVESIAATLVEAENAKVRINGVTGERIDLEKQRAAEAAAKLERERTAAAEQAEAERIAAEEQAKMDATEAARQKRLAAEHKKKQAEEDARYAKAKAEQDAKDAEERRRIRAACGVVYQHTADKKIADLTVREEQQVRACQALGLYPPP